MFLIHDVWNPKFDADSCLQRIPSLGGQWADFKTKNRFNLGFPDEFSLNMSVSLWEFSFHPGFTAGFHVTLPPATQPEVRSFFTGEICGDPGQYDACEDRCSLANFREFEQSCWAAPDPIQKRVEDELHLSYMIGIYRLGRCYKMLKVIIWYMYDRYILIYIHNYIYILT
jgi:hypothetical protein